MSTSYAYHKQTAEFLARYGIQIWKSIVVGNLDNAKAAQKRLKSKRCSFEEEHVVGLIEQVRFVATETALDLVCVSLRELGFLDKATITQVYSKAKSYGLLFCPQETTLQLCIQYPDLLYPGESLTVATEPIVESGDFWKMLTMCRTDQDRLCLVARGVGTGYRWDTDSRWVFACLQ